MWRGNSLKESCKVLDHNGIDLLQVFEIKNLLIIIKLNLGLNNISKIENVGLYAHEPHKRQMYTQASLF